MTRHRPGAKRRAGIFCPPLFLSILGGSPARIFCLPLFLLAFLASLFPLSLLVMAGPQPRAFSFVPLLYWQVFRPVLSIHARQMPRWIFLPESSKLPLVPPNFRLMFLQLPTSDPGNWNPQNVFQVFFLFLSAGLIINECRRWARATFDTDEGSGKKPIHKWTLRPSNTLILAGAAFYIYRGTHEWLTEFRFTGIIAVLLIGFGFVLRKWEDDAVRDTDVSDLDIEDPRDPSRKK